MVTVDLMAPVAGHTRYVGAEESPYGQGLAVLLQAEQLERHVTCLDSFSWERRRDQTVGDRSWWCLLMHCWRALRGSRRQV